MKRPREEDGPRACWMAVGRRRGGAKAVENGEGGGAKAAAGEGGGGGEQGPRSKIDIVVAHVEHFLACLVLRQNNQIKLEIKLKIKRSCPR